LASRNSRREKEPKMSKKKQLVDELMELLTHPYIALADEDDPGPLLAYWPLIVEVVEKIGVIVATDERIEAIAQAKEMARGRKPVLLPFRRGGRRGGREDAAG